MNDYVDNKYEAYLDRGRLYALDLDTGDIYAVKLEGLRVFSSLPDEECPYEIYEDESGELICINVNTGEERKAELVNG